MAEGNPSRLHAELLCKGKKLHYRALRLRMHQKAPFPMDRRGYSGGKKGFSRPEGIPILQGKLHNSCSGLRLLSRKLSVAVYVHPLKDFSLKDVLKLPFRFLKQPVSPGIKRPFVKAGGGKDLHTAPFRNFTKPLFHSTASHGLRIYQGPSSRPAIAFRLRCGLLHIVHA